MPVWLEFDTVAEAQQSSDTAPLVAAGILWCMSNDRTYCVRVREHSAWHVEGRGWYYANCSPNTPGSGRPRMNFFKLQRGEEIGFGFRAFVPRKVSLSSLGTIDDDRFEIVTDTGSFPLRFEDLEGLMWSVMTGTGEKEKQIEASFAAMLGS